MALTAEQLAATEKLLEYIIVDVTSNSKRFPHHFYVRRPDGSMMGVNFYPSTKDVEDVIALSDMGVRQDIERNYGIR